MENFVPRKAFVLAAGLGSRLKELTRETPKCLLEVGGKTMLLHQLESLREFGVRQICVNVHYKAEQVRSYLSELRNLGIEVAISQEDTLLDTGGALKHATWFLQGNEPFFVVNADILTDLPLDSLTRSLTKGTIAALVVMERQEASRIVTNGVSQMLGVQVFEGDFPKNSKAFAGIALYAPSILPYLTCNSNDVFSVKDVWKAALSAGEYIAAVEAPTESVWFDIGTPETLAASRSMFPDKRKYNK